MNLKRRQAGQATTELVVLSLALLPLLMLVPMLGKLLDLMQTAEVASRYVAFEATVHHGRAGWKSDAQLADEVRRRFFSRSDAAIRTGDAVSDEEAERQRLWRDQRGRPLLPHLVQQVGVAATRQGFNFHAPTRPVWESLLRLPEDSLVTAGITVRPARTVGLAPFDAIDLVVSRRLAVLVDPWNARSVDDVRARVEPTVPLSVLNGALTELGQFTGLLTDPPFVPGMPAWDVVPPDRLGPRP